MASLEQYLQTQPTNSWDLNQDGKLSKKEADSWWMRGNGTSITVDNKNIDWTGLEIPENEQVSCSISTTGAFTDLPFETAATYGGTSFKIINKKNNIVRVLDQDYHYDMRKGWYPSDISRNIITRIGMPFVLGPGHPAKGVTFKIHYANPYIKIK